MLTDVKYLQIEDKMDNVAVSSMDELLEILLTKTKRELDGSCEILRTNGYKHRTRKLEAGSDSADQQDPRCTVDASIKPEPPRLRTDKMCVTVTHNPSGEEVWDEGDCWAYRRTLFIADFPKTITTQYNALAS